MFFSHPPTHSPVLACNGCNYAALFLIIGLLVVTSFYLIRLAIRSDDNTSSTDDDDTFSSTALGFFVLSTLDDDITTGDNE